jgi:protein-disulfide isomerase
MSKQFWAILAVIAIVLGGIFVITNKQNAKDPSKTAATTATHHTEGTGSTGVTLQEYGDFQCPVCGTFYPATEQVVEKYKDKITFQFSHLPLTQLHPNAFAAARAAEAAGLQGKFFEMYNQLYQNQNVWSSSSNAQSIFEGYAQQLGLNVATFTKDYASARVNGAINADIAAFKKTGEDMGTPTYFLDGKKIDNAKLFDASNQPSVEKFSALIDAAIAAKTKQ